MAFFLSFVLKVKSHVIPLHWLANWKKQTNMMKSAPLLNAFPKPEGTFVIRKDDLVTDVQNSNLNID